MMGTIYQISVDAPEATASPAVAAAFDEIARLEDLLSEWREESSVSRVNAAAGERPVAVDADTLRVVKAGLEISAWSDGAFDLTWAALRGLYDYQRGTSPSAAELARRLPLVDYRDVVVDEAARTVFLRRRKMALGTGGIGKGYALDRAAEVLESRGI
ncbi:MAG: FAD:protein FMN transferase, partial [Polyangiaceae bacterium]|nr:FAD:protein FMN transferase [Polyangiaceae bacterium]